MTTSQANQLKYIYDNITTTIEKINIIEPKEMYFCHFATTSTSGLYYNGSVSVALGTATSNTGNYISMKRNTSTYTFTVNKNCKILFYNNTNEAFASGVYNTLTAGETFTVICGSGNCFAILIKEP